MIIDTAASLRVVFDGPPPDDLGRKEVLVVGLRRVDGHGSVVNDEVLNSIGCRSEDGTPAAELRRSSCSPQVALPLDGGFAIFRGRPLLA